ncbi:hypothetical protein [Desulfobulbus sp.]|uniref:hypothetical protein n=1 Tax=Desulfobulbus sp. TaxID=895 RepID=UPI0027B88A21|nr:hypothetical protein [Desulfobulbus sp.]
MIKRLVKLVILILAVISGGIIWQQAQLCILALNQIDPIPETRVMVAKEHYAEAADYLGFFMGYDYVSQNPDAQLLYRNISNKRENWRYQASKFAEGLIQGTSDEATGKVTGVITDFLVIGDLRDLAKQGVKHIKGEDTDEVLVALASLGVIATGAQVASGAGTVATGGMAAPTVAGTTAAKGSLTALKIARKLGKLPPWLGEAIIKAVKMTKETKNLGTISGVLGDVGTLAKTRGGCNLLSMTKDAASLNRMGTFAATFGSNSVTLYHIGGDLIVNSAQKFGKTGKDIVQLAATFGQNGLRTLDKVGAVQFSKYSARASKTIYKGEIFRLVASLLLMAPIWLLYGIIAVCCATWLPWHALFPLIKRIYSIQPKPPSIDNTL